MALCSCSTKELVCTLLRALPRSESYPCRPLHTSGCRCSDARTVMTHCPAAAAALQPLFHPRPGCLQHSLLARHERCRHASSLPNHTGKLLDAATPEARRRFEASMRRPAQCRASRRRRRVHGGARGIGEAYGPRRAAGSAGNPASARWERVTRHEARVATCSNLVTSCSNCWRRTLALVVVLVLSSYI